MDRFGAWLAESPWGGVVKAFLGALLAVLLSVKDVLPLPAPWGDLAALALGAAVPVLINYVNGADARYGRGSEATP